MTAPLAHFSPKTVAARAIREDKHAAEEIRPYVRVALGDTVGQVVARLAGSESMTDRELLEAREQIRGAFAFAREVDALMRKREPSDGR